MYYLITIYRNMGKKALVISSGGSKGAYAGGIIEYLSETKNWDLFIGSSTGSLIAPFVASNDIKGLKNCYLNINSDKIYSRDPFVIKENKNGNFKYSINHFNIALNLIKDGRKTLGTTNKLRELIYKVFTESHYDTIKNNNKDVQICVTNLTNRSLEVKSINEFNREDFCDWIWASTCAPPFMSIFNKNGFEYVDGGLMRSIPIKEAIIAGATEIDVIVLNPENHVNQIEKVRNVLHLIQLLIKTFILKSQSDDLNLFSLIKEVKISEEIKINIYYTQRDLTNNSLLFNSELMKKWWEEGYLFAKSNICSSYILRKSSVIQVKK